MQETCSNDITELAKALLNVQRQLHPAMKDAKNPFIGSNYASLNSVMDTCRDALLENGIWLCQYPVPVDTPGAIGLATKLTHAESGQWQSSLAVVPLPKADPHGMGSAITYARRYSLSAMLGIITEDDDGEAAKIDPKMRGRARRPVNVPQMQKPSSDMESQTPSTFRGLNGLPDPLQNLPQLEGISYKIVAAQDGRQCIIASGNTLPRKEILIGAGFRWSGERKIWWKYADAA